MKKVLCMLSLCGIILLSGCWDRVEINDLAIVTAAAIDATDDNQIELSLQVFIPKALGSGGGQGGGGGGGGGATTLLRSHKGINVSDAMSKLQAEIPRKIFWGQCKVFIFGDKLAKKGIQKEIDFILRHPQARERSYLFVSEGKAKSELEFQATLERYSAESIRELSALHIGMQVTVQDIDEMLIGKSQAAAIPIVIHKSLGKEQAYPSIAGTAVFKKDKMIGKISERATRGILWLRDEMEAYTVTVKPKGVSGEITLNPVSAHVKMVPHIQNGKWKMLVKVTTEGAVIENGTNLLLSSPQSIKNVEKAFEESIKKRIELALQEAQHRMKVDIVGFGKEFYRKYPKQWKQNENRWEQVYPEVEVTIDVDGHIRRQGYITTPGGMPEKEVREK